MINTNESLFVFRDMANQMFKLAIACRDGDTKSAIQSYDDGLTTMLRVLEAKDAEHKMNTAMSSEIGNTITNAYLARDIFEPAPVPSSTLVKTPPTLIIHNDVSPHVVVTKEDTTEKVIHLPASNHVLERLRIPCLTHSSGSDADDEGTLVFNKDEEEGDVVEEDVEIVEEEEQEEVAEAEAEAEEADESMEVIKIGRKKYYLGEISKKVFVFVNDEESGDCLGKYADGKIVPLM